LAPSIDSPGSFSPGSFDRFWSPGSPQGLGGAGSSAGSRLFWSSPSRQVSLSSGGLPFSKSPSSSSVKYALQKDSNRRRQFLDRETRSVHFRSLLRSQRLSSPLRQRLYPCWGDRLLALPGRIRNRCFLTGRSGSPQTPFNLSRQTLRTLAVRGLVPGLARSSWLSLRPPLP